MPRPRITISNDDARFVPAPRAELKAKMVMRIYSVSRARAAAIIAGRAGERQALEEAEVRARFFKFFVLLNG